jgi:hypothetical protein
MHMTAVDLWLQRGYWLVQILLIFVATFAVIAAYRQIATFKLFELLKYMERPELREARRIVILEITPLKGTTWWDTVRLANAASALAAAYDHLGCILRYSGIGRTGRFFLDRWGETAVISHEVVDDFLKFRRETSPNAYEGYTWLYKIAKPRFPNLKPPVLPPKAASQDIEERDTDVKS